MATHTTRSCWVLATTVLLMLPAILPGEEKAGENVQQLIQALRHEDVMVRLRAARSLGEMGVKAEPAIEALKEALNDQDQDVRLVAKRAIERIQLQGNPQLTQLIADLKAPDPLTRLRAAKALGDLGGAAAPALTALEQALADEDEDVRRVARNAIERINTSGSPKVRQLMEQLKDPDALVRLSAAKQLGDLGAEARPAIDALKVALQDPDEVVRMVAKNALAKLEKAGAVTLDQGGAVLTDAVKEIAVAKVERMFSPPEINAAGMINHPGGMRFLVTLKNTGQRTIRIGTLRVKWTLGGEEIHNNDVDGPVLPLLAGQTCRHLFVIPWDRNCKWDRRTQSNVEIALATPLELDAADRLKVETARQEISNLQIVNPAGVYAFDILIGDRFIIQNNNDHICKGVLIELRAFDRTKEWVYSLLYYAPLVPQGFTHVENEPPKTLQTTRPVVKLVNYNRAKPTFHVERFEGIVLAVGLEEDELPK